MNKLIEDECKNRQPCKKLQSFFSRFAQQASRQAGRASSFALAVALVVLWGVCGPLFDFSVAWQVAINTTCTVITFLMVLLIQNSQYRDTQAIQMKLDELIQTNQNARNDLIEIEKLTEGEIEEVRDIQREIREQSEHSHSRSSDRKNERPSGKGSK